MKLYFCFLMTLFICFSGFAQTDTNAELRRLKKKASIDSLNLVLNWKEIKDGLFINKNGDLGFIGAQIISAPDVFATVYQTNFCDSKNTPLNTVVDSKTFKLIAGGGFGAYYKDKKHIYHTFGTSGGENFSIVEEADYATFKMVNDCYAKDKNYIYHIRFGLIENADPKTFKILEFNYRCYAKDKNAYYRDEQILEGYLLNDPEIQKVIKKLDKL